MSRVIPFSALATLSDQARDARSTASLHGAVTEARRRHRPLIASAGEWALSQGIPLPGDHVALWAATTRAAGVPGDVDGITGPWRASHIPTLAETATTWCVLAGCSAPDDLARSWWDLYGFLSAGNRLHPSSDSLLELRAALVVLTGFERISRVANLAPGPIAG